MDNIFTKENFDTAIETQLNRVRNASSLLKHGQILQKQADVEKLILIAIERLITECGI